MTVAQQGVLYCQSEIRAATWVQPVTCEANQASLVNAWYLALPANVRVRL